MNKEKMMDMRMGRICEVQRKLYTLESECGAVKAQLRGAFYREDMDQPVIADYELGMCDVDEGLENTFSDIAELIAQCRFTDCRHMTEPGCAIRGAIREQTLSKSRWELYCSLYEENKLSTVKSGGERSRKTKSNLSGFKCRKGEECDRSERFR